MLPASVAAVGWPGGRGSVDASIAGDSVVTGSPAGKGHATPSHPSGGYDPRMSKRPRSRKLITTGQLFAVVDDPVNAPEIITELGRMGVDSNQVTLLRGTEGAARIDAIGERGGLGGRMRQAVSFTLADQMPDFVLYEAAVLDGRSVLAMPVESDELKRAIVGLLRGRGAHFINYYGRFATEELDAWRGPELVIPSLLRR
jgi:hypothetical protein